MKLKTTKDGWPLPQRCPMHKMWMRKGQCEICLLNEDIKRKQQEALTGSNKPEVTIKKV